MEPRRRLFIVAFAVAASVGLVVPAAAQTTTSTSSPTSTASVSATYVAMGDSYSSGVGNTPYASALNTPLGTSGVTMVQPGDSASDGCNRSAQLDGAYPNVVAQGLGLNSFVNAACSGASVGAMHVKNHGETSQLRSIGPSTTLVTITAGGDDQPGFLRVVAACSSLVVTKGRRVTSALWRISHFTNDVTCPSAVSLEQGALGTNGESAMAGLFTKILKRMSPQGHLVVVEYPPLAELTGRRVCLASTRFVMPHTTWRESIGFSASDYARLRALLAQLDATIVAAANEAGATAPGRVVVASIPTTTPWFRCRGPGGSRSALRGIVLSASARPPRWSSTLMAACHLLWRRGPTNARYATCASGAWAASLVAQGTSGQSIVSGGSLHPTAKGQVKLANAVLSALKAAGT